MAKYRTIAKVEHVIYESMEEFKESNPDEKVNLEWRRGRAGNWVLGDDGSVQEVLKRGALGTREYIRTAAGQFAIWDGGYLSSNFKKCIYNFSGKTHPSGRLSQRERIFVSMMALAISTGNYADPVEYYLKVFKTNSESIARVKVKLLIEQERIVSAIKKSVESAGEETGATLEWSLETIKKTVDESKSDAIKIRGAGMIADLHTKENASPTGGEMAGAFQGFTEIPPGDAPAEHKQLPE